MKQAKRNRLAVWLDASDETVRWLKYEVPPKERGRVIRKALELYLKFSFVEENKISNLSADKERKEKISYYKALAKRLTKKVKKLEEKIKKEKQALVVDENAVIIGEAVLSQIQLAFPDRDISDDLIQTILVRGIRDLKKEEAEMEKRELLGLEKL